MRYVGLSGVEWYGSVEMMNHVELSCVDWLLVELS